MASGEAKSHHHLEADGKLRTVRVPIERMHDWQQRLFDPCGGRPARVVFGMY